MYIGVLRVHACTQTGPSIKGTIVRKCFTGILKVLSLKAHAVGMLHMLLDMSTYLGCGLPIMHALFGVSWQTKVERKKKGTRWSCTRGSIGEAEWVTVGVHLVRDVVGHGAGHGGRFSREA